MKMNCERHSESLLLFVHNELRGWSRLQTEAHLLLCPECRTKERRLRALSTTLAISFKNPSLGSRTFRRSRRAIWATLGLGAASAVFVTSQLLGTQFSTATASNNTGVHCDLEQAHVAVKLVPPPVPKPAMTMTKPTIKAIVDGSKKHACLRELR